MQILSVLISVQGNLRKEVIEPISKVLQDDLIRKYFKYPFAEAWTENNYLDPSKKYTQTIIAIAEADCSKKLKINDIKKKIISEFGTKKGFYEVLKDLGLGDLHAEDFPTECESKCCANKIKIPFYNAIVNAGFFMNSGVFVLYDMDFGMFVKTFAKLNKKSIQMGGSKIDWSMLDLEKNISPLRGLL